MLLLHGVVNAGAKFLLGQPALVEKLGQQGVVRFGDVLDQFAVQLLTFSFHSPAAGSSRNLPRPSAMS